MRYFISIFSSILLTIITARYFHRLRHIRLENSYCTGYQELKDHKCSARLTSCSTSLQPNELTAMRQVLCGFRLDPALQTDPPANGNGLGHHGFHPKYYKDIYETDIHSYKFVASIYSADRKFLCIGSLLSPKIVITSAQCVSPQTRKKRKKRQGEEEKKSKDEKEKKSPDEERKKRQDEGESEGEPQGGDGGDGGTPDVEVIPSRLTVRFGEQHLHINPSYKNVYEFDVESVHISETYDEATHENDIAIIRLVHSVPICKFPPVFIPRKYDWKYDFYHIPGTQAKYLGWGLSNQRPYFRAQLGKVLSQHYCQKLFNWDYNQLNKSHLCVDSHSGVCVSDIGGPLITYSNHHWVLIGVLTFGKHCKTPGLPLIFARISEHIEKITEFINEDFRSRNTTIHPECIHHYHQPHHHIHPHHIDAHYHYNKHYGYAPHHYPTKHHDPHHSIDAEHYPIKPHESHHGVDDEHYPTKHHGPQHETDDEHYPTKHQDPHHEYDGGHYSKPQGHNLAIDVLHFPIKPLDHSYAIKSEPHNTIDGTQLNEANPHVGAHGSAHSIEEDIDFKYI